MKKKLKPFLAFFCFVLLGCGEFKNPIHGEWIGEQGSRIKFRENNRFVWYKSNGIEITGLYSADLKFPKHLDLYSEKRHYKCAITILRSSSEKKILICFGEEGYPLMLDREKGEIFTALNK